MPSVLYIAPLDTDTEISWWNVNRSRLNAVILAFNAWQKVERFESHAGQVVLAMVTECRTFGQDNHFSDWQFETLDKMEAHLKRVLDME